MVENKYTEAKSNTNEKNAERCTASTACECAKEMTVDMHGTFTYKKEGQDGGDLKRILDGFLNEGLRAKCLDLSGS